MSMTDLQRRFDHFFFAPASATNVGVARVLIAATALWVVLSREGLASVTAYPGEMWSSVSLARRVRFLHVLPSSLEEILFAILHLTLLGALIGILPRLCCFVSGLLLYHFAPLESIFWTPNAYLRGLTIPALALLILAFAPSGDSFAMRPGRRGSPPQNRGDYRWPVVLIQILFAQIYFFSGYAKLVTSGLGWMEARNIQRYLILLNQYLGFPRASTAYVLAEFPLLCGAIAWTGMLFDLTFPVALFAPRTRWVIIPLAAFFHAANGWFFRILFQDAILLLLFVDWDPVFQRVRSLSFARNRIAPEA